MTVQKGLLEALHVLLLQPDAANAETCGALEAELTEVVQKAALRAAGELRSGVEDASAAAALCRFLASTAEVGVLTDTALSQHFKSELITAACAAGKMHSNDEHAQNWAIWLRAVVDGSLLQSDLTAAIASSSTVTVRSALWVTKELAYRHELQNPGFFLPLVLQAMNMQDVGDRGPQALEAVCECGQAWDQLLTPEDRSTMLVYVEQVLPKHTDDWGVLSALLAAISNLVGLQGHVCLLNNSSIANNLDLVKAVLYHIGNPRKTQIEALEVGHSNAVLAIASWADHPSEDVCELALYALQRLLDSSSSLGYSCESLMNQGLACIVRTFARIDVSSLKPDSNLKQHLLHALNVVVACQLPAVRTELGKHRESIWRVVHTRLLLNNTQPDELKQLCNLVLMTDGIARLEEILRLRPLNENLMRAACEVVAESDHLEAPDISLHAMSLVQNTFEFFEHCRGRGREPAFGELNAVVGALGRALGHLDVASSRPLIEKGLTVLMQLTHHAFISLPGSEGYFSVLHNCFWSLREVVSSAGGQALETVAACRTSLRTAGALQVLQPALESVMQQVSNAADTEETESQGAFEEGLTVLAVLLGHQCVLVSMRLYPNTRSVQATCCKVFRTLAQMGEMPRDDRQRQEVIAALQWAQRTFDGDAEIDTPVAHALGFVELTSPHP